MIICLSFSISVKLFQYLVWAITTQILQIIFQKYLLIWLSKMSEIMWVQNAPPRSCIEHYF